MAQKRGYEVIRLSNYDELPKFYAPLLLILHTFYVIWGTNIKALIPGAKWRFIVFRLKTLLFHILRGRITPLLLFSAGMNKDMLICSSFKVATLNAFLCYCLSGRFVDVQKSLLRINYITLSTAVLYRFNNAEKQAWKSYQCFFVHFLYDWWPTFISICFIKLHHFKIISKFVTYIAQEMILCN